MKKRNVVEGNRKDQSGQKLKYWPLIGVLPSLDKGELVIHDLHCDGSLEGVLRLLLRQELITSAVCRSPMHGILFMNNIINHIMHSI